MKNMIFFYIITLILIVSCSQRTEVRTGAPGEETLYEKTSGDDYFRKDFLRYENFIYKNNIKTVTLHRLGQELSAPVIELRSPDKLIMGFDDLDGDIKQYSYTLIHCDADWTPSRLIPSQYITGFNDESLTNHRFSYNSIQRYTHWELVFPTNELRPVVSGNYLIKIYQSYQPDDIVLTQRFMVADPKVAIEGTVRRPTIAKYRNSMQEIDFIIHHDNYLIDNPYGDIHVVISQNDRWDNVIAGLKPLFVRNNELIYNYEEGNLFNGGNEFRVFDTRSVRYNSEAIREIIYDSLLYRVFLYNDEPRSSKRYFSHQDINGRFVIRKQEGRNAYLEAEYTMVHFRLLYDEPVIDGNIYVFGALTNWNYGPGSLMKYNFEERAYEAALYLKQGYYNYEYVFVQDGSNEADATFIEGNHYETENNYVIYVYHRPIGGQYDQLIGVRRLNSLRD
jgi:hypothetical protein